MTPRALTELAPIKMWVIKSKYTNHPTAGGIYMTEAEALADFKTIPGGLGSFTNGTRLCGGVCGVGCADDYEIREVVVTPARQRVPVRVVVEKQC